MIQNLRLFAPSLVYTGVAWALFATKQAIQQGHPRLAKVVTYAALTLIMAAAFTPLALGFGAGGDTPYPVWVVATLVLTALTVLAETRPQGFFEWVRHVGNAPITMATATAGGIGNAPAWNVASEQTRQGNPRELAGKAPDVFCAWNIVSAADKTPPCTFEGPFGPIAGFPGSFYPTPEQLLKPAAKGRIRYVANGRWVDAPFTLPKPGTEEFYTFSEEYCPPVPQCTSEQEWLFVLGITNAMVNQVHETRARKKAAAKRAAAEVLAEERDGRAMPGASNVIPLAERRRRRA